MSKQGHGLHRLAGGIRKREHDAWQRIDEGCECHLSRCHQPGVALVQNWCGQLVPACGPHSEQARELGYTVLVQRPDN
jgi:hypothetical protein